MVRCKQINKFKKIVAFGGIRNPASLVNQPCVRAVRDWCELLRSKYTQGYAIQVPTSHTQENTIHIPHSTHGALPHAKATLPLSSSTCIIAPPSSASPCFLTPFYEEFTSPVAFLDPSQIITPPSQVMHPSWGRTPTVFSTNDQSTYQLLQLLQN